MIRKAIKGDEHSIHRLIQALADYEKAPNEVSNTAEALGQHLFEEQVCDAFVAEKEGEIIGFALFYTSYSTWKGKCLYLEDFYVLDQFRGEHFGSQLFQKVIDEAKSRGVKRMDWQVLSWNQPAIDFYNYKNALLDEEWINCRYNF